MRSTVGAESDHLAVEDDRVDRKRERRGRHLGHAVGDVGEAPGEGAHLASESMDLDARAVQLPLDGSRSGPPHRVGDCLRRLREHRLHGSEHLEPKALEPRLALGQRGFRHGGKLAREHERAPNVDRGNLGRPRHRVDHDPLERSLAELAVEDAAEKRLLSLRRQCEDRAELTAPRLLRAAAGRRSHTTEGGVDVEHLE